MIIYLVTFVLAILFFSLALSGSKTCSMSLQYIRVKKHDSAYVYLCLLLSASFPILLAAFRDDSVGTDLQTYGIIYWEMACDSPSFFVYLISLAGLGGTEIGYSILNWVVSCFTKDIHWFFFVHQSIVLFFLYAAIWKFRNKNSSVFVLLFYFLYAYNLSLSLLRQSIAITIVLYGSTYLFSDGKKKWFYICVVLATLFHNSSVFAFLIPAIKYISIRYSKKLVGVYAIVFIGTIGLIYFYQSIIGSFIAYGLLPVKYEMYLDQEGFSSHKINLLVESSIFVANFFLIPRKTRSVIFFNYVQLLAFVCILLEMVGGIVEIAFRVVMYLILVYCLYAHNISNCRAVVNRTLLFYCFAATVMFVYIYSQMGVISSDTIPYTSAILGIK